MGDIRETESDAKEDSLLRHTASTVSPYGILGRGKTSVVEGSAGGNATPELGCKGVTDAATVHVLSSTGALAYLREKVKPRMIKDRRWDSRVGVGDLFDLVWQSQHHLRQKLSIGLKDISSMALEKNTHERAMTENFPRPQLGTGLVVGTRYVGDGKWHPPKLEWTLTDCLVHKPRKTLGSGGNFITCRAYGSDRSHHS